MGAHHLSAITLALGPIVLGLAHSPTCAAADLNEDLRVVLQTDPNGQDWNESATMSADGRYVVAVGSATGTIVIWDAASGNIINRITLPMKIADHARVGQPSFSPDNASISVDAFVKRNAPFVCRQFRFTYTLATGTFQRDLVAATPPGQTQGLSPAEQAICQGGTSPSASGSSAPGTAAPGASGRRAEVRSGVDSYAANPIPDNAIAVLDRDGSTITLLAKKIADQLFTAALSPDARYLAYVNTGDVVGVPHGMTAARPTRPSRRSCRSTGSCRKCASPIFRPARRETPRWSRLRCKRASIRTPPMARRARASIICACSAIMH